MRTKLLLIVFIISTFAFSANSNEDTTKIQIENLQKENENLKKEIEIIKVKSESSSVMIDNVDSMYQNNFDRMIFLFGSLGAIIVFVFPFWMQQTQKKLLKIKEEELNASNTKMINEVLKDFNEKLSESEKKYIQNLDREVKSLQELINNKTNKINNTHNELFTTTTYTIFGLASDMMENQKEYNKSVEYLIHSINAYSIYKDNYGSENINLFKRIKKNIIEHDVTISKDSIETLLKFSKNLKKRNLKEDFEVIEVLDEILNKIKD